MIDMIFGANAKRYTICWGIRTKKTKKNKVAGIVLMTK